MGKTNLDLNRDGKFDKEDATIAGQVLSKFKEKENVVIKAEVVSQEEIIKQEVEKRLVAERRKLAEQEQQRTIDRLKPADQQCKCRDCAALRGELEPKLSPR